MAILRLLMMKDFSIEEHCSRIKILSRVDLWILNSTRFFKVVDRRSKNFSRSYSTSGVLCMYSI